jgi:hypothetical protein
MPKSSNEFKELEAKFPIVQSKTKSFKEVKTFLDYLKCEDV